MLSCRCCNLQGERSAAAAGLVEELLSSQRAHQEQGGSAPAAAADIEGSGSEDEVEGAGAKGAGGDAEAAEEGGQQRQVVRKALGRCSPLVVRFCSGTAGCREGGTVAAAALLCVGRGVGMGGAGASTVQALDWLAVHIRQLELHW